MCVSECTCVFVCVLGSYRIVVRLRLVNTPPTIIVIRFSARKLERGLSDNKGNFPTPGESTNSPVKLVRLEKSRFEMDVMELLRRFLRKRGRGTSHQHRQADRQHTHIQLTAASGRFGLRKRRWEST